MNIYKKMLIVFSFYTCTLPINTQLYGQKPRLTVLIVVDQLAYSYMQKLRPFLDGGLKELMRKGINYTNAYVPHGIPATATGHAGLNTGTFAKDHGIIRNSWIENNKKIDCDDDSEKNAAVFSPHGLYNYGKSPRNIMVDGISDQFVLSSQPLTPRAAIALSLKSRAAINTANKLGKAIWFDAQTGLFTSSKAYFETLPDWLNTFNKKQSVSNITQLTWKLAKPKNKYAYNFYGINNYSYTESPKSLINATMIIDKNKDAKNRFEQFMKTPQANKLLFDLARSCITQYLTQSKEQELMLWLDLSGLDLLGHAYGPESKESIDFIYHLDKQLSSFIRFAQKMAGKKRVLFALTADHGIASIPEHVEKKGLTAPRISQEKLIADMNDFIQNKFEISNAIIGFQAPQFYLNPEHFPSTFENKSGIMHGLKNALRSKKTTTQEVKNNIIHELKNFLLKQSAVKQVWSYDELQQLTFEPYELENFFKQQLYPGRSGSIIVQTHPYTEITRWKTGADHRTPYNYNTHVPLILYQHSAIELKTVNTRVWNLQLANTLAEILNIPRPSASTMEVLPDLYSFGNCGL